jgi:hypothetical protein
MTDTPIRDALKRIDDLPDNEVRIGGVVTGQGEGIDAGAVLEADHDFGKPGGWKAGGEASWFKKAGWKVAGMLSWRKDGR